MAGSGAGLDWAQLEERHDARSATDAIDFQEDAMIGLNRVEIREVSAGKPARMEPRALRYKHDTAEVKGGGGVVL